MNCWSNINQLNLQLFLFQSHWNILKSRNQIPVPPAFWTFLRRQGRLRHLLSGANSPTNRCKDVDIFAVIFQQQVGVFFHRTTSTTNSECQWDEPTKHGDKHGDKYQQNWWFNQRPSGQKGLPSGKLTKLWKITFFNGKTKYKWPFSIAMLVYQSVNTKKNIRIGFASRD